MSELSTINSRLQVSHPAAWACLSDLGRRLYFPLGIPAQAQEARSCPINATIGQVTNGHGGAVPLPAMVGRISGLSPEQVVLYSPTPGNRNLRDLWATRLEQQGCAPTCLPLVTQGLTHGLSLIADLFCDTETEVLLPNPGWGNYHHIFATRRGATIRPYGAVHSTGMDLDAVDQALSKAGSGSVLVLNFPSNPIGYSLTVAEAEALVDRICAHPRPLVVVTDDAYQGMLWEPGLHQGSLFPQLCQAAPEHILPIKIDGATKELFFFGGRVGFITFGCPLESAEVLVEKATASIRATISSAATPSQNLVRSALEDPMLEAQIQVLRENIRVRYVQLKGELATAGIQTWPFNSAFFTMIPVSAKPDSIRRSLLGKGVGVVSLPQASAIRLSYASVATEDIEALVKSLYESLH